MTFKKKTIISLFAISGTFVLAIMLVVGIFAISNVSVKTNMSVTYTSNVVGATYSLRYSNGSASYTYVERDISINSAGSNPSVTTSDISNDYTQLDTTNTYCTWCWEFKNTGTNAFTASLTYQDTEIADVSMTIKIYSTTGTSTPLDINFSSVVLGNLTYFDNITISSGSTMYFYVKYVLNTNSQYAELSGNFNWTLTAVEPTTAE